MLGPGLGREELKELKEDMIRLGEVFMGEEVFEDEIAEDEWA